jgi:hypothetical protein
MALVLQGDGDITGLVAGALPSTVIGTGAIRQVVQGTYSTQVSVASSTYVDSGLTASITPTSSSSRILVMVNHTNVRKANDIITRIRLLRGETTIFGTNPMMDTGTSVTHESGYSFNFLDTPSTTSSVTYKTQINSNGSTATYQIQGTTSFITLLEIA